MILFFDCFIHLCWGFVIYNGSRLFKVRIGNKLCDLLIILIEMITIVVTIVVIEDYIIGEIMTRLSKVKVKFNKICYF